VIQISTSHQADKASRSDLVSSHEPASGYRVAVGRLRVRCRSGKAVSSICAWW